MMTQTIPNHKVLMKLEDILEDQIVTQNDKEQNDLLDETTTTPKKNVRKKILNPSKWKINVRREAHQSGKEYTNKKGEKVKAKKVKNLKNCAVSCKYKCSSKICDQERSDIHLAFYTLKTSTEKRHFILNTTDRSLTARPKRIHVPVQDPKSIASDESDGSSVTDKPEKSSRRKYSFMFFFNVKSEKIQVCKKFYLGTLDISQKPIYTAHATKNMNTNTPTEDKRGKSMVNRRKPEGNVDFCHNHIESFPCIELHYCRSHTNRKYLGSHLSISKMYSLYVEDCKEKDIPPVKKSMYYRVFEMEFNLGFHIPKSDRCDVCEAYKVAKKVGTLTEEKENDFQHHQLLKTHMRESRKQEKDQKEPCSPVLLFDLQNVIMTPHADISSLFYLRKLNIYNLTAHFSVTKKVYCALWPESLSGRAGNDLASALKKILDIVIEENELTKITLWSDSCVPQNHNSIMSNAILDFIRTNPQIKNVTVKYSLPGHSCVQEVDNVHSQIEKAMRTTDFYSPIGFICLLKSVSPKNPYKIIQMKESDFKDFASTAKLLNYKTIP
ncbi:uncharacterized protein LOC111056478 [Nilaparvata lugens]|uniref:uncharacterized protein LOC111056478 n=1 Tax=Nilaparvata lugens TaxID=108931 RepID=UPI000B98CCA8|nr:uncharacterized protein LOC111056478 [Nilaparvata lugens]